MPWAINSEIYPIRYRGLAGGLAATTNWVTNFLVAQTFLSLVSFVGPSNTFLFFGGISLFALLFVALKLPETNGISLQEVEKLWGFDPKVGEASENERIFVLEDSEDEEEKDKF